MNIMCVRYIVNGRELGCDRVGRHLEVVLCEIKEA